MVEIDEDQAEELPHQLSIKVETKNLIDRGINLLDIILTSSNNKFKDYEGVIELRVDIFEDGYTPNNLPPTFDEELITVWALEYGEAWEYTLPGVSDPEFLDSTYADIA